MPHEFVHSWNGKFRRPADLWTPTFKQPMQDDLLWVYEGLTDYWCGVLTARAGLWDAAQIPRFAGLDRRGDGAPQRSRLAFAAGHRRCRTADLLRRRRLDAISAAVPTSIPRANCCGWTWTRSIRELSGNKHSLDDFARAFYGMDNGSYVTKTYTFDDVVNTLNQVQPYDWAAFLRERLDYTGSELPEHGIERGGWKLVYTDTPNAMDKAMEKVRHGVNLAYSLGLSASGKGDIYDVQWDSAAFKAGLVPGLTIVAVNGKDYSVRRAQGCGHRRQGRQCADRVAGEERRSLQQLQRGLPRRPEISAPGARQRQGPARRHRRRAQVTPRPLGASGASRPHPTPSIEEMPI